MDKKSFLTWIPLSLVFGTMTAQNQPAFKTEVEIVYVEATVRDAEGRIVNELKREDFIVYENDTHREIEYFARQSDRPLTLALLVDTSLSQRRVLKEQRQASKAFFDTVLRSGEDLAVVLGFDVDVELLANLTNSQPALEAALDRLEVPEARGRAGVGTVLFDSVFLAAEEVLETQTGRKAIVLISDGVDFGSMMSLEQSVAASLGAESILYAIRYYDPEMAYGGGPRNGGGARGRPGGMGRGRGGGGRGDPGGGRGGRPSAGRKSPSDGLETLTRLTKETGGALFEVSETSPLEDIFAIIEEELRSQYVLGFKPKDGEENFRKIHVTARKPGLTVRSRAGYFRNGPAIEAEAP